MVAIHLSLRRVVQGRGVFPQIQQQVASKGEKSIEISVGMSDGQENGPFQWRQQLFEQ